MAHLLGTNPLVIAHRGASGKAPENTFAAFNLAWKEGSDAIELDIRQSKDSNFVCLHDENLARFFPDKKNISSMNLDELKEIEIGSWKGSEFKNEKIPLLSEVLLNTPKNKKIFIEIKEEIEDLKPLFDEIKKTKIRINQCHFLSYFPKVVKNIKENYPRYKATINIRPNLYNYEFDKVIEKIKKSYSDGVSLKIDTKESLRLLKKLKKDNYFVIGWTINDKNFMEKLIKNNIDGIITDYPIKLKKILKKYA